MLNLVESDSSISERPAREKRRACTLHSVVGLCSLLWVFLCLYMVISARQRVQGETRMASVAVGGNGFAVLLHLCSFCCGSLQIVSVTVVVLTLHTIFAMIITVSYLFHCQGFAFSRCLFHESCTTNLLGPDGPKQHQAIFEENFRSVAYDTLHVLLTGPSHTIDDTYSMRGIQGVEVRSLVPASIAYSTATKVLVLICFIIYVMAVVVIVLYVWRYRTMGHPYNGHWIPAWMKLDRLVFMMLVCVLGLIYMLVMSFAKAPSLIYAFPLLLAVVTFIQLCTKLRSTCRVVSRAVVSFSSWRKRKETLEAVSLTLSLTYVVGSCSLFALCGEANVWPSGLHRWSLALLGVACSMHIVLNCGYVLIIRTHLTIVKMENVSLTLAPVSEVPQPSAPPLLEGECVACLENTKNALLVPCNHLCLCYPCAEEVMRRGNPKCPICRESADDVVRVYT